MACVVFSGETPSFWTGTMMFVINKKEDCLFPFLQPFFISYPSQTQLQDWCVCPREAQTHDSHLPVMLSPPVHTWSVNTIIYLLICSLFFCQFGGGMVTEPSCHHLTHCPMCNLLSPFMDLCSWKLSFGCHFQWDRQSKTKWSILWFKMKIYTYEGLHRFVFN